MSATSRRAARRERCAAELVGSARVHRAIGESAPDVVPCELPLGLAVIVEAKSRKSPLRTIARWLEQASGYAPGHAPIVAVYTLGQHAGEALVVMRAADWQRAVGLAPVPAQGALPLGVKP